MNQIRESVRQRTLFRFIHPVCRAVPNLTKARQKAANARCRRSIPCGNSSENSSKNKRPWPETSTGARMNPRTSLICGGLALVVMGLAAARVTYSLYDIQIKTVTPTASWPQSSSCWIPPSRPPAARSTIPPASRWPPPAWCGPSGPTRTTAKSYIPPPARMRMRCARWTRPCAPRSARADPAPALRRRRKSGRGGHFLGSVPDPVPEGLRCTFQDGHQVSGAGHQGEQRCQAVHRILRFPVQQGTQACH